MADKRMVWGFVPPQGLEGDALHGLKDGLGDFLPAVAHCLKPHARHHVEGFAAVYVGEPATLAALVNVQRVGCLGKIVHLMERQPQMVDRHLTQFFKFLVFNRRRHHPSSFDEWFSIAPVG